VEDGESQPNALVPSSTDLDPHGADFGANPFVEAMFAQIGQPRFFGQPFKIVKSQRQRSLETSHRQLVLLRQRVATREIVMDQGIVRPQPRQALIHSQSFFNIATTHVILAKNLQGVDILRSASHDAFQETDLDIEIPLFPLSQLSFEVDFVGHILGNDLAQEVVPVKPRPERSERLSFLIVICSHFIEPDRVGLKSARLARTTLGMNSLIHALNHSSASEFVTLV
jgi:hypothetical protein